MIVSIVSQCRGKAAKRSQRVLDRYLHRTGSRTWMGRITLEGLNDVRDQLRKGASRNNAIACTRVTGRDRTTLEWTVGSRKAFSPDGSCAIATASIDEDARSEATSTRPIAYSILKQIVTLSALTHDVGKAGASFQRMLTKGVKEQIRHEYVSVLFLTQLGELCRNEPGDRDQRWLNALSRPDQARSLIEKAMRAAVTMAREQVASEAKGAKNKSAPVVIPDRVAFPLLHAVAWVVLTHHRLPHSDLGPYKDEVVPTQSKHVKPEEKARPGLCKEVTPLWDEGAWVEALAKAAAETADVLLQAGNEITLDTGAVAVVGRLSLLLGDHAASAKGSWTSPTPPAEAKRLFANTHAREKGKLAEPLADHLCSVTRHVRAAFRALHRDASLPSVLPADIPTAIRSPREATSSRFYWQRRAAEAVRRHQDRGIQSAGFFGVVMAGTGSGKTRAVPILTSALSGSLRYTLALGLRTLTLQSADEYVREVGFPERHVVSQIGSELAQKLHEMSTTEAFGRHEDEVGALVSLAETPDEEFDQHLPPTFAKMVEANTRNRRFLKAPITVATVDSLMKVADARRSGHDIQALRVATADLVLDEIDAYDPEDLAAISRLVYVAGCFGRRVIIASATVSPVIASALFKAWSAGYRTHAALTGRLDETGRPRIFAGWFAERGETPRIEEIAEDNDFSRVHDEVARSIVDSPSPDSLRRRCDWLETEDVQGMDALWGRIHAACAGLHAQHCITDPKTGKRLSIGLVRFANVKPAREMARYLAAAAPLDSIDHRIICYHARLTLVMRQAIERFLTTACNRKQGDEALLCDPHVRRALEESESEDVMIVISGTPMIETGRDCDLDWMVVDPSSTRAVIQAGGRIRRHRDGEVAEPNLVVLERPVRWLRNRLNGKTDAPVYIWPGVESAGGPHTSNDPRWIRLRDLPSSDLFDSQAWRRRLDAHHCLIEPEKATTHIGWAEHAKLRSYLESDEKQLLAPSYFYGGRLEDQLGSYHPDNRRFRRDQRAKLLFWRVPEDEDSETSVWRRQMFDPAGKEASNEASSSHCVEEETLSPSQAARFLIPYDEDSMFRPIAKKLFEEEDDEMARKYLLSFELPVGRAKRVRVVYNDYLGGDDDRPLVA